MEIEAALKILKEANKPKDGGQNEDFLSQNRQLQITSSDDSTTEILAEIEVEAENNEEFSNEFFLEKLDLNVPTPVQDLESDIPNLEVVISENNGAQAQFDQRGSYTKLLCRS